MAGTTLEVPGCPRTNGTFGPGTDSALIDRTTLEVPGCPRTDGTSRTWTDDALRPWREQPWKSQVVLGQMGHLGPGTDDGLIDHVGNNLESPRLS